MPLTDDHRLVLLPRDPDRAPVSLPPLIQALTGCGLIGEPWPDGGPAAWLAGDRFLQLITFLGCSPNLHLAPEPDSPLSYVSLAPVSPGPRMRRAAGASARCPACRTAITPAPGADPASLLRCPGCGATSPVYRLDWRRGAGFGRLFIDIHNVFPHEAVPTDALLDTLSMTTTIGWDYFYL